MDHGPQERTEDSRGLGRWPESLSLHFERGGLVGRLGPVFVLLGATFLAGFGLVDNEALPEGGDALFHLQLADGFRTGFEHGEIYPRWISDANNGFGSPALVNYAPLGAFVLGVVYWVVDDLALATRMVLLLSAFLSGVSFFVCVRPFTRRFDASFLAAAYILLPYHVLNLYERSAFAEFHCFVLYPLVFHFARQLLDSPRAKPFFGFVLSYAALLLTHVLGAYMALFFVVPVVLLAACALRWRSVLAIGAGGVWATLLSGVYVVPLLMGRGDVQQDHLLNASWGNLLRNFLFRDEVAHGFTRSGIKPRLEESFLLLAAAGLIALVFAPYKRRPKAIAVLAALVLGAAFLQTELAGWVYDAVPETGFIVFPWRFQAFQGLFTLVLAGVVFSNPKKRSAQLMIALALGAGVHVSCKYWDIRPYRLQPTTLLQRVRPHVQPEHIPASVPDPIRLHRGRFPSVPSRASIDEGTARVLAWGPSHRKIAVLAEAPGTLLVKTFAHPAWTATVSGAPVAVIPDPRTGILSVPVPDGESVVEFRLQPVRGERAGALVSALSALCLLLAGLGVFGLYVRRRKRSRV